MVDEVAYRFPDISRYYRALYAAVKDGALYARRSFARSDFPWKWGTSAMLYNAVAFICFSMETRVTGSVMCQEIDGIHLILRDFARDIVPIPTSLSPASSWNASPQSRPPTYVAAPRHLVHETIWIALVSSTCMSV